MVKKPTNTITKDLETAMKAGVVERITSEMAPGLNRKKRRGLYICMGRGRVGKTVVSRMLIEFFKIAGREVKIVDFEMVNAGLHDVLDDVIQPATRLQNGFEVIEMLMPHLEALVGTDDTLFIDTEGNSTLFAEAFFEADMLDVLRTLGIDVHIIVVCGAEPDDVAGLELLATAFGKSEPPDVYIAVPERLLPPRYRIHRDALTQELLGSELMKNLHVKRIVYLPTCPAIANLDKVKISYRDAAADEGPNNTDKNPTHLLHRKTIGKFVTKMDTALGDLA